MSTQCHYQTKEHSQLLLSHRWIRVLTKLSQSVLQMW